MSKLVSVEKVIELINNNEDINGDAHLSLIHEISKLDDEQGLYKCPFEKGATCKMDDPCFGCEAYEEAKKLDEEGEK